jgi:hypothetical protein
VHQQAVGSYAKMEEGKSTDSEWVDVAGDLQQMKAEDEASRKNDLLVVFQNQRW